MNKFIIAIFLLNYLIHIQAYDIVQFSVTYKNNTFDLSSIWTEVLDTRSEQPNKCFIPEANEYLEVGAESRPIGKCKLYKCIESGKYLQKGCGSVAFDTPCTSLGMDFSKPYPFCCHRIKCKDVKGNDFVYQPLGPAYGDELNDQLGKHYSKAYN